MNRYVAGDDLKVNMIITKSGVAVDAGEVPFDVTLWVGDPSRSVSARWDGEQCENCSVAGSCVTVRVAKPGLPSGTVAGKVTMHYPDSSMASGVRDETLPIRMEVPEAWMAQSGMTEVDGMVSHEVVGLQGAAGKDGEDGKDGRDGAQGIQGKDGGGGGFYNLDARIPLADGEHYSKESAVAAVAGSAQVNDEDKVGMIISYWDSDNSKWRNYRYALEEVTAADFGDAANWTEFSAGGSGSGGDYTCKITQVSSQSQTVSGSAKGVNIKYKVSIVDADGISTGELANCTITVRKANGEAQSFNRQVSQGVEVGIVVDDYIGTGTNTIIVRAVGVTTGTVGQSSYQIIVVSLTLSSSFDLGKTYSGTMIVPYTLEGDGTKTVEMYVDGVLSGSDTVVQSSVSNTKQLTISGLSLTRHTLQIRASVTDVTFGTFYSKTLYYDFFVRGAVSALIGIGCELAEGTLVSAGAAPVLSGVTQFGQYGYKIAAYNPAGESTAVTIYENSVSKGEIDVGNATVVEYVNVAKASGSITILLMAGGDNYYQLGMEVSSSGTDLVEITDGLELDLSALGRSNSASNRDQWSYSDAAGNTVSTGFSGVPWTSTCGWAESRWLLLANGGKATVGLNVLKAADKSSGKTIEMEFKTGNVMDEDAVVAAAYGTYGLLIKANSVELTSQAGVTVETKYKAGEQVRVALVIHATNDGQRPMLVDLYVNGIHSGCSSYLPTDSFAVDSGLVMGSDKADLYVKAIKVYGKALSDDDVLNNYIIDRDDAAELLARYASNNILTADGGIDLTEVINEVPVMVLTGDVDTLVALNDKSASVRVKVAYQEVEDETRSFVQEGVKLKLQGTSSLTYPRKNFKFTLNEAWALRDNSFAAKAYCLKADFAESSGTHNTGVARLWNEVLTGAGIKTEAQTAYDAWCAAHGVTGKDKKDVRTTVDGHPILLFWRRSEGAGAEFLGKYNLNTDKAAEQTFGFRDIPGYDDGKASPAECWEFTDNTNPLALFGTVEGWETGWSNAFERRFPDDDSTEDTTELKKLCTWLTACNPLMAENAADRLARLKKFKDEASGWMDVEALCAYYLYTEYFGATDQRVKNCMLATYGWNADGTNKLWRFVNYDNDTILGVRNDGKLTYDYLIDEETVDATVNDYAYAGHDSGLWACVRQTLSAELTETAQKISSGDYALSYARAIAMLNGEQMGKWCERVYNKDGEYKYVEPYVASGSPYLYSLQGSREAHRTWWLYNRFAILDSKYSCGNFRGNYLSFLAAGAPKGLTFTVVPSVKMYLSWGYNNQVAERSALTEAGEAVTFTNPVLNQIGNVASVYGGAYLREVDLSAMAQYLARVDTRYMGDDAALTTLILGGSGVSNTGLVASALNLSNATKLQVLDVRGMTALTGLNLTMMTKLTELRMEGSGVATLALPESSVVSVLHYGSSIINILLEGMESLTTSGLTIEGYGNVLTMKVTGCPNVDMQSKVEAWLASGPAADCSIEMDGVAWSGLSEADMLLLMSMGSCKLTGSIALGSLSAANKARLVDKFGDIDEESNGLHVTYPNAVTIASNVRKLKGGTGTVEVTVSCTKAGDEKTEINLTEDGSKYFSISGGEVVVDAVTRTASRTFVCTTITLGANTATFVARAAVDGETLSGRPRLSVVGTNMVTVVSAAVRSGGEEADRFYCESKRLALEAYPTNSDGTAGWKDVSGDALSTDTHEVAWIISQYSGDVSDVFVDAEGSGDGLVYVVKKVNSDAEEVEIARLPKYADVNDKGKTTNVLALTRYVDELDDELVSGEGNIKIMAIISVTNRTAGSVGTVLQPVVLHPEYFAVQAYDPAAVNYNPAVCIILQKKGVIDRTALYPEGGMYLGDDGKKGLVLTMAQAEEVKNFGAASVGWFNNITSVEPTNISDCVEGLSSYDFTGFDELRFFGNVPTYGYSMISGPDDAICMFKDCTLLQSVTYPRGTKTIGNSAFEALRFGRCPFQGCTALKTVKGLDDVETIYYGTFYKCTSLEWVSLPPKLSYLYNDVFNGCSSLKISVLHENLRVIGRDAFSNTACTFTIIPFNVTSFGNQTNIKSVSMSYPNTMSSPGGLAYCPNLKVVTFRLDGSSSYVLRDFPGFVLCPMLSSIGPEVDVKDKCAIIPNGTQTLDLTYLGSNALLSCICPSTLVNIYKAERLNNFTLKLVHAPAVTTYSFWIVSQTTGILCYYFNALAQNADRYFDFGTKAIVFLDIDVPPLLNGTLNNPSVGKFMVRRGKKEAFITSTRWAEYSSIIVEYDFDTDAANIKNAYYGVDQTGADGEKVIRIGIPLVDPVITFPSETTCKVQCTDSLRPSGYNALNIHYTINGD